MVNMGYKTYALTHLCFIYAFNIGFKAYVNSFACRFADKSVFSVPHLF